jgi:antitoxin (DNA-binding transcriptional repressor) of toxin-antitoxin stability system
MKRVELREANQRLSEMVKLLRAGQSAILTHRGKPLAVLKPLPEPVDAEAMIRRLEFMGLVRAAAKQTSQPRWTARPLKGVPLSQTLRDERDRV